MALALDDYHVIESVDVHESMRFRRRLIDHGDEPTRQHRVQARRNNNKLWP